MGYWYSDTDVNVINEITKAKSGPDKDVITAIITVIYIIYFLI